MAPAAAASTKNPFQISVAENRPILAHPNDAVSNPEPVERPARLGATPMFVSLLPSDFPRPQILEGAQLAGILHSDQSEQIEPKASTNLIPIFKQVERVIAVPSLNQPSGRFQKLQQYEGDVLSVGESDFTARLTDLTDRDRQRLEATFSTEEVSESDKPLLREGAVFYWIIGYKDEPNGQRTTSQLLRFRRLPVWSKRDLERLQARADELKAFLQSDD